MKTEIYFISASGADGEDSDWFVEAETPEQAITLFTKESIEDERIESQEDVDIRWVHKIPEKLGSPRVLGWGTDVSVAYRGERDE